MKRRVLMISPEFAPELSGFANAAANLAGLLVSTGDVAVDVVTLRPPGADGLGVWNGVRVFNLRLPPLPRLAVPGWDRMRFEHSQWCRRRMIRHQLAALGVAEGHDVVLVETLRHPGLWELVRETLNIPPDRVALRLHGTADTEHLAFEARHRRDLRDARRFCRRIPVVTATTPHYLDFYRHHICANPLEAMRQRLAVLPNYAPSCSYASSDGEGGGGRSQLATASVW